LRDAHSEILSLGAGALAVGTGAGFQAEKLMRDGLSFPALVDPEKHFYRALGIRRVRWDQWFRLTTWNRYARSIGRARQGHLTGDILQAPGIVVLDRERTIRYLHRGVGPGDYPPLYEVLGALSAASC
jgi:hypothetical protein